MSKLKADITELLIFFDELDPLTEEELGVYWFKTKREDNLRILLVCSIYERNVSISVGFNDIVVSRTCMENCSEVRILDQEKKFLEAIHNDGKGRCLLSLQGNTIVEYTEKRD